MLILIYNQSVTLLRLTIYLNRGWINKGIEGVSKIKDGYNPSTWMLEISTAAQEMALGVDFADVYKNSELYK